MVENMQDNIILGPIDIRCATFEEVTKLVMVDAIHGGLDLQDPDTREAIISGLRDAIDFFDNFEFGTEMGD